MSKLFSWFKKDQNTKQNSQSESEASSQENAGNDLVQTNSVQVPVEQAEQHATQQQDLQISEGVPQQTANPQAERIPESNEVLKARLIKDEADFKKHVNQVATARSNAQTVAVLRDKLESDKFDGPSEELASQPTAMLTQATQEGLAIQVDNESGQQPAKSSLFSRLKSSLARTKANIGSGFNSLLRGKSIDDELYEELETQLLLADVGMNTTNKIIGELTQNAKNSQLRDGEALANMLQSQMQTILDKVNRPIDFSIASDADGKKHPFVILMVGVNGVGKTTTIGKLARQYQAQGKSVMLAAGDTFRAAAVEQLQVWGERNDIAVVAQHTGADSASVIFDAIASAQAKNADILIADTAGRLQNKEHLIEELKKVVRVMKKLIPNSPHEIMLTLDASTGQNAVSQTRIFNEAVGITGINLTKLDGSAKGGVIFALADEFDIPVRYIGIGEGIDDLREFESKAFVDALFAD